MSDSDLEIESITDDVPEPDRPYYVELIELPELRRYVCLDLARMCEPLAKDVVKIAREMDAFLQGKGPRAVE